MNQLTIFRLKKDYTDPDDMLPERGSLADFQVKIGESHLGVLYVRRSEREIPSWVSYFGVSVDLANQELSTSVISAVLLLANNGYTFAISFGYGRYLLAEEAIDKRFGLLVTLNAVEPTELRSIDHKRLEFIQRHTREELSRASGMAQFGVDVERDLLRSVTGTPSDPQYGKRLGGSDQLTVIGDIPLSELTNYLGRVSKLASLENYKVNFPWVDNICEIADARLAHELDNRLVTMLKRRDEGDFWLAPPEIVDWINVAAFRYSTRKRAIDCADLDFVDYFNEYGSAHDLTVQRLEQDRVYCLKADDETMKRSWAIRRCLVGELEYKKTRYVLSEGRWYAINRSFFETLDEYVAAIPRSAIRFPDYAQQNEAEYNAYAARKFKSLKCLDQNFVVFPGRGKVEVCDLYSVEKIFIHVKRYSASSTLSHLFSQGTVSAQLMVGESSFRAKFQEKLPAAFHWGEPSAQFQADQFQVCYAIIGKRGRDLVLPFFSKVNLRTAVRSIQGVGLHVSLASIRSS